MSTLGTVLDLDDGARLTNISLLPELPEEPSDGEWLCLHVVELPDGRNDAVSASGAVATFVPGTLATTAGELPDGRPWFGTFQPAPPGRPFAWVSRTADAAVLRALDLVGIPVEDLSARWLLAEELRESYRGPGGGDVSRWPLRDVLTGLLVELAGAGTLPEVTGGDSASGREESVEDRRCRLSGLLEGWAQTYEGPWA